MAETGAGQDTNGGREANKRPQLEIRPEGSSDITSHFFKVIDSNFGEQVQLREFDGAQR